MIVRPANLTQVAEAMLQFDLAKRQLIRPEDIQKIAGKEFVKKSGWRRLARAFTLSTAILSHAVERDADGRVASAWFIVRASHPNGAFSDGWGGADKFERRFNKDQDIIATAQTRATNRAISDLIAGGEVSADEMSEDGEPVPGRAKVTKPTPKPTNGGHPTEKQVKMIYAIAEKVISRDFGEWISEYTKGRTADPAELTYDEGQAVIAHLKSLEATPEG